MSPGAAGGRCYLTTWVTSILCLHALMTCVVTRAAGTFSAEERAHWAFQPVHRPEPSAVAGSGNPIDAFIETKLESHGLQLPTRADRNPLLRRATLDLTGLPPSPREIERFVNDTSTDAFDRLV